MMDAMNYAGLLELIEWDGVTPFTNAVAKVLKNDGNVYYCIVKALPNGTFGVIRDFGAVANIVRYISIYPYSKDKAKTSSLVESFKFKNKQQRLDYIKVHGIAVENPEKMTVKELEDVINNYNAKNNGN